MILPSSCQIKIAGSVIIVVVVETVELERDGEVSVVDLLAVVKAVLVG